jgi:hypothetical protein
MSISMNPSIERALGNAEASLRMEGFTTSEVVINECRKVLTGELSHEDYVAAVKRKYMKVEEIDNCGI